MAPRCFEHDEIERLLVLLHEMLENADEGGYNRRQRRLKATNDLLTRCVRREGVWRLATDNQIAIARKLKARLNILQGDSHAIPSHDR